MNRTFVCASSCIKHYVQLSYGCRGTPVVAGMCVYTAGKIISSKYRSPETPTCEVPSNGVIEISLLPVCTGDTSILD